MRMQNDFKDRNKLRLPPLSFEVFYSISVNAAAKTIEVELDSERGLKESRLKVVDGMEDKVC